MYLLIDDTNKIYFTEMKQHVKDILGHCKVLLIEEKTLNC